MPQKGLKKDDGVRGRREKISSKFFPFFPDHKSTFIGNSALLNSRNLVEKFFHHCSCQFRTAETIINPGKILGKGLDS